MCVCVRREERSVFFASVCTWVCALASVHACSCLRLLLVQCAFNVSVHAMCACAQGENFATI